jgi:phosphohistidine phosphatase
MKVYLLRHAEAEEGMVADFQRELTGQGIRRIRAAARVLKALGVRPAHLYSSPRVRARQTAEIVGEALDVAVKIDEGLDFECGPDVVARLVTGLRPDDEIMLVGHEPGMSATLHALTGARLVMKKGGLARVDVAFYTSPLRGELVWLIAPKVFDVLGGKDDEEGWS